MNLEVGKLYYNDFKECIVKVTSRIEKPDETGVDKPSSYTATVLIGNLTFGERNLFFAADSKFDNHLEEIITLLETRKKKVIRSIWNTIHG